MTYRFEFGKWDSILLAGGVLALCVVLFLAGFFTDRLITKQSLLVRIPAGTPSSGQQAVSAAPPAAKAGTAGTNQRSPGGAALQGPVTNGTAGPANSVQLAVQVGVFGELAKAKRLAEQLQKEGYSPVIASQAGSENQQISVVQIGPFSTWEDAARVAKVIGRSLGTRPAIRPML